MQRDEYQYQFNGFRREYSINDFRRIAQFIFHGRLNDFLAPSQREKTLDYFFQGRPSVKDAIEAMGIPHPEVDLIEVNSRLVDFSYLLQDNDLIVVFPKKYSSPSNRFILDVHLGALSRYLRLLGIDTDYNNQWDDIEIIRVARMTERIILTRDVGLLKHKSVLMGYWLRSTLPKQQVQEVLDHFQLRAHLNPLSRCISCNGSILEVKKEQVMERLPPKTRIFYQEFFQCQSCSKIYWRGAHFQKIQTLIHDLIHTNNK